MIAFTAPGAAQLRGFAAGLEWVKVAAFAAMVLDHVDLLLFSRSVPALHAVGAFAFPAFCLAFGYGLRHSRRPRDIAVDLAVVGLVAQVVWSLAGYWHGLNVLLVFAGCAAVEAVSDRRLRLVAGLALVGVGGVLEGGAFGPLLVFGGWLAGREGPYRLAWLALPALWVVWAPSPGALAAVAAVAWSLQLRGVGTRLTGPWLLWAYPGHLAVLAALAALTA